MTQKRKLSQPPKDTRSRLEQLEHALFVMAEIVLLHGPVYAPYLDRLEKEIELARKGNPADRAKAIMLAYRARLPQEPPRPLKTETPLLAAPDSHSAPVTPPLET